MKKRRSIFIDESLWNDLEKLKLKTGTPISFSIEKGVRKLLKEGKMI